MEDTPKEDSSNRERIWEKVQIKAFTSWLNSYLEKREKKLNDLQNDLQDGTLLNHFLEIVSDKKLGRWELAPSRKVHKLENLSIGLNYIQNDLKIRLVGIGSEDIFNCHLKLILGLVWSLFRGIRLTKLTAGEGKASKSMEESLLKWVREVTGDLGVAPTDFKYGFRDGLAFAALVSKYDPSVLNFHEVKKEDPTTLLEMAFELAEKHMNIPQLLSPSDLTEGDPDERSVQLYVSLFFHAFTSKREKEEMEAANKGIASQLEDLDSRLQREARERQELLRQKELLEAKQAELESTLKTRHQHALELENTVQKLQSDITELSSQVQVLQNLKAKDLELAEKLGHLQETVRKEKTSGGGDSSESDALRQQIEALRTEINDLRKNLGGNHEERSAAAKELAEKQAQLDKEAAELEAMLEKETAARALRDKKHHRLISDRDTLTKKLALASKGSAGWRLLSKNLEEHIEDLHCWRAVQEEGEADPQKKIEVKPLVPSIFSTKSWSHQAALLTERLEAENKALFKSLTAKDAVGRKRDAQIKSGWLTKKGQRNPSSWKKRYFVLGIDTLSYYKTDEPKSEVKASISLATCEVNPQTSDEGHEWLLKVVVEERELVLEAESKESRDAWICAAASLAAAHTYRKDSDESDVRPDPRLLSFLSGETCPSTALRLDDRPLSPEALRALAVLRYHSNLKLFSMENAEVEDEDIRRLASTLAALPQLLVLRLGKNKISSTGTRAVAEALSKMKDLEELYLDENDIGGEGAEALAQSIANKPNIRVLELSGSKIGDKGAEAIANALTEEHALESLLLSRNAISDEGAQAVGELLRRRTNLESVHLGTNNISDHGAKAIADALQENQKVIEVDLSGNNLSNVGANHIRQAFHSNTTLEGFNLSENKLQCGTDLVSFLDMESFFFPKLTFSRRIGK